MTAPEIFHRDTDLHLEESAPISWRSIVAAGILLLVPLYDPVAARAESPVTKINAAAATAPVTVQTLRANISVLEGSGGNITVLSGKSGKLLVDAGIAVSREKVEAALAEIGPGKLVYLINTHWHWDHTDGNAWMHAAGATIIGRPQTRERLAVSTRVNDWDYTFRPMPAAARPTIIVKKDESLDFDGETVFIHPYGRAHTDTDLSVYFNQADVLATGDTFWNGWYPFIDYSTGGSIDGAIRAANENIARAGKTTLVVPGHGPVTDLDGLVKFRDMLVAIRHNVSVLKKEGLSVEQVVARHPTAAFDAAWGQHVIDPAFFVRLVYRGV